MNKFNFVLFIIVVALGQQIIALKSEHEKLSWKKFEQDFRAKYSHLNIPAIRIDTDSSAYAEYCDIGDVSVEYTKYVSKAKYNFIVINPNFAHSPEEVEWVLLHEIGHHNYNLEQRQKAHVAAEQKSKNVMACITPMVKGLQNLLMCANGYQILRYRPHIGLLIAQGAVMQINKHNDFIKKTVTSSFEDVIETRPEEYAADAFANQHATKEALLAGQYLVSKKGFIEYLRLKDLEEQEKQHSNDSWNASKFRYQVIKLLRPYSYRLLAVYDLSHPSPYKRHKIITQALKDRFNVNE